jgi:hypothetical protein
MTSLPSVYNPFIGFAAIFFCVGFGMLFLRKAVSSEIGPGYWAAGFFLNGAGFLFWAGKIRFEHGFFFIIGDFLHMIGFITLVCGAYGFAGKKFQKWHWGALGGLGASWLLAMGLFQQNTPLSFLLLMSLRAILFIWAGHMILTCISTNSKAGRTLTGGSLITWGVYVILFPFIFRVPELVPLAIGFLIGFHILAGMGMVILVVDRIRFRAEESETHIKRLEGLIPICSNCKKIRDDHDSWHILEAYIQERSDATFSHGICPDCSDTLYGEETWYKEMKKSKINLK